MTLGEKIRQARKRCGLSQEQLAQMLCVSRSAVAKWETDKGLPDITNLKVLGKLLNVSVDSLLDEEQTARSATVREKFDLASYGRGCKKVKKDRYIREKFPAGRIYSLMGRLDPAKTEGIKSVKNQDQEFYLVELEDAQYFVTVTDAFAEIQLLEQPITESDFQLGDWHFIRSNYEVE